MIIIVYYTPKPPILAIPIVTLPKAQRTESSDPLSMTRAPILNSLERP